MPKIASNLQTTQKTNYALDNTNNNNNNDQSRIEGIISPISKNKNNPNLSRLSNNTLINDLGGRQSFVNNNTSSRISQRLSQIQEAPTAMSRYDKKNDSSQFWQQNHLHAAKTKLLGDVTPSLQSQKTIATRGQVVQEFNQQVVKRNPKGEEKPEQMMRGTSMAEILHQGQFMKPRQSADLGKSEDLSFVQMRILSPAPVNSLQKRIKKAHESSHSDLIGTRSSRDIMAQRDFTKSEIQKQLSRERYFTSQITTLQGPAMGLNALKTRDNVVITKVENQKNHNIKAPNHDKIFASHICTLQNSIVSTQNTQSQIEQNERARDEGLRNKKSFVAKTNFLHNGEFTSNMLPQQGVSGAEASRKIVKVDLRKPDTFRNREYHSSNVF